MNALTEFLLMALTALTLENAMLVRALGINRHILSIRKFSDILLLSSFLTLITTLSSAISWKINESFITYHAPGIYRSFSFSAAICLIYLLFHFIIRYLPAAVRDPLKGILPLSVFNCAVLGSILLAASQNDTFPQFIGYGFGTGVGFLLALLLVCEGGRRLDMLAVPKAFRGLPIRLLYIGLISLAFFGLSGHQLPA